MLKIRLYDILRRNCNGKENAKSLTYFANVTGYSKRHIRRTINDLISYDLTPIGSCQKGYFLFKDGKEMWDYVWHLDDQQRGIQRRIEGIVRACPKEWRNKGCTRF